MEVEEEWNIPSCSGLSADTGSNAEDARRCTAPSGRSHTSRSEKVEKQIWVQRPEKKSLKLRRCAASEHLT